MALKFQSLFLFTLLLPFLLSDAYAAIGGRREALMGGYQPIKNLNDPEVQEAAQFAVVEHNKEAGTNLKYESVVSGKSQVVSGINYWLLILARDGGASGNYEAVVYEKPWLNYKNLTSFEKVKV